MFFEPRYQEYLAEASHVFDKSVFGEWINMFNGWFNWSANYLILMGHPIFGFEVIGAKWRHSRHNKVCKFGVVSLLSNMCGSRLGYSY